MLVWVSFLNTTGNWCCLLEGKVCKQLATSKPPGKAGEVGDSKATHLSTGGQLTRTCPFRGLLYLLQVLTLERAS